MTPVHQAHAAATAPVSIHEQPTKLIGEYFQSAELQEFITKSLHIE